MSKTTVELLEEPKPPLRYRIPREGPSPREYELLECQRRRALTADEATELQMEQDTRTEMAAQWAEYHEKRRAYDAQQARMRS